MDDYAAALWTAVSTWATATRSGAIVGSIVALGPGGRGIPTQWRQRREPLAPMLRQGPTG